MKKYRIEIAIKFDHNPTTKEYEAIRDKMIDKIDKLFKYGKRSMMTIYPMYRDIEENHFTHRLNVFIETDLEVCSSPLFKILNEIHPLVLVMVKETRFDKREGGIFWYHEGETTFSDGSTYISPNYEFYVNDNTHYTVHYVPITIKNYFERDKKKYENVNWMWSSVGSWDNFLKALTLDEALKEFEEYYENICWKAVENNRERLMSSEDLYRQITKYRWDKVNKEIKQ